MTPGSSGPWPLVTRELVTSRATRKVTEPRRSGRRPRQLPAGASDRERLAQADPTNASAQRDLSSAIGRWRRPARQRRSSWRPASYQQALAIPAPGPGRPDQRQRPARASVSHELGDVQRARGDLAGARAATAALAIASGWPRPTRPTPAPSTTWRRLRQIGDVQQASGDLAGARASYRGAGDREQLAQADPTNASAQRDLASLQQGWRRPASQRRSGRRPRQLPAGAGDSRATGPGRPDRRRRPARPELQLQQCWRRPAGQRRPGRRPASYRRALAIRRAAGPGRPDQRLAQRDLSVSYE